MWWNYGMEYLREWTFEGEPKFSVGETEEKLR